MTAATPQAAGILTALRILAETLASAVGFRARRLTFTASLSALRVVTWMVPHNLDGKEVTKSVAKHVKQIAPRS
jgi:hypothetical protein